MLTEQGLRELLTDVDERLGDSNPIDPRLARQWLYALWTELCARTQPAEVCAQLTASQIKAIDDLLEKRREWKRGVKDCPWCGQRSADLNEHPCFIAEETAIAFTAAVSTEAHEK